MEKLMEKADLISGNICLRRITVSDLEMIRNWRNSLEVAQYMAYREHITAEMQKNWFQHIDNENNFYFIIEVSGTPIGMVDLKDVDYTKRQAEAGIFIADQQYQNNVYSVQAMSMLYDFAFRDLKLKQLYAHILRSNHRAIRYNLFFGYQLAAEESETENELPLYILTAENYECCRKRFSGLL